MVRHVSISRTLVAFAASLVLAVAQQTGHSEENMDQKKPAKLPAVPEGHEVATFAAGCYWCVEAVYQRIGGVISVTSGFTGGHVENPGYEAVCTGTTGHAEAVRVVFDPGKVSYRQLLDWFWRLHDPTTLNRQGADVGTQYRSGIFYHSEAQKKAATASRANAQEKFAQPIVTEITKAAVFYPAQVSHQDYYRINGNRDGYCRAVIAPKLEKLKLDKKRE